MTLSHLNARQQPTMVDVGSKAITQRQATAQVHIHFPSGLLDALNMSPDNEPSSRKGPVIHTAILAGTMAAKRTPELIPLCHHIPLDACTLSVEETATDEWTITCTVKATHKTGVEMEALTGASVAALTVYDMCKALSHDILIKELKLIEKRGGKSDRHDHR